MKKDEPEHAPIIYPCNWRYGPGTFCGVHLDRPLSLCPKHQAEDRKRLATLKARKTKEANADG